MPTQTPTDDGNPGANRDRNRQRTRSDELQPRYRPRPNDARSRPALPHSCLRSLHPRSLPRHRCQQTSRLSNPLPLKRRRQNQPPPKSQRPTPTTEPTATETLTPTVEVPVVPVATLTATGVAVTEDAIYRGDLARTGVMDGTGPGGSVAIAWDVQLDEPSFASPIEASGSDLRRWRRRDHACLRCGYRGDRLGVPRKR